VDAVFSGTALRVPAAGYDEGLFWRQSGSAQTLESLLRYMGILKNMEDGCVDPGKLLGLKGI
jgi:hypothetical protein